MDDDYEDDESTPPEPTWLLIHVPGTGPYRLQDVPWDKVASGESL